MFDEKICHFTHFGIGFIPTLLSSNPSGNQPIFDAVCQLENEENRKIILQNDFTEKFRQINLHWNSNHGQLQHFCLCTRCNANVDWRPFSNQKQTQQLQWHAQKFVFDDFRQIGEKNQPWFHEIFRCWLPGFLEWSDFNLPLLCPLLWEQPSFGPALPDFWVIPKVESLKWNFKRAFSKLIFHVKFQFLLILINSFWALSFLKSEFQVVRKFEENLKTLVTLQLSSSDLFCALKRRSCSKACNKHSQDQEYNVSTPVSAQN